MSRLLTVSLVALVVSTVAVAVGDVAATYVTDETARSIDAAQIRGQLAAWDEALVSGEYATLNGILAEEFFHGELDRESFVEAHQVCESFGIRYTDSFRESIAMRFYGDVAFVTAQRAV